MNMYVTPSMKIITISPANIVCESKGSTKNDGYVEDYFDWNE